MTQEAWFVISPDGIEQFCSCAASEEQAILEFFFAEEEPYENEYWDDAWWIEKQSEGFKCEPRILVKVDLMAGKAGQ